jgi:hypothetical protein
MKRTLFLTLVGVLAFGFVFTSCGSGGSSPAITVPVTPSVAKTLKITGISGSGTVAVAVLRSFALGNGDIIACGTGDISGGELTVSLKEGEDPSNPAWTGSGSYYIGFWSNLPPNGGPDYAVFTSTNFSAAVTTVAWNNFEPVNTQPKKLKITGITGGATNVSVSLVDT